MLASVPSSKTLKSILPVLLLVFLTTTLQAEAAELTLLYNGSVNGKLADCGCKSRPLGGLARRAAMIHDLESNHGDLLVLDAGNLLAHPSKADGRQRSAFVAAATQTMGYDVVGVGPNELGFGVDELRELAANTGLAFTSANFVLDGELVFEPYRIVQSQGRRVGVLSLVDPSFAKAPYNDRTPSAQILDPVEALDRWLPELREKSDFVVVLSSMEQGMDLDLVRALSDDIDVIVEGVLTRQFRRAKKVGNTRIVAANPSGKYLGQLDLEIDGDQVVNETTTVHALELKLPEDSLLAASVAEFQAEFQETEVQLAKRK